jgi:MoaA/NifB/PqqE/SkfB family radical SAM enzyme
MCDIWKIDTVEEIGLEHLERHAADLAELGVRWVVFSGGEPLMHSDLFGLSRFLRAMRIRTTILTTGLLLPRRAAAVVADIDDAIVSLDGPAEIHNRIRGVPRAYELL